MRESPSDTPAIKSRVLSSILILYLPRPFSLSSNALLRSVFISSFKSFSSIYVFTLERSAEFTSKEGFSVVAPIRIIVPFSTYGRKASCWALLKRCISSIKSIVLVPLVLSSCPAIFIMSFICLIPVLTAEKEINLLFVLFAIILARVVFPEPGGPQKMIEWRRSLSIILWRTFPSPTRCFCPTNPSRPAGLILSARGIPAVTFFEISELKSSNRVKVYPLIVLI